MSLASVRRDYRTVFEAASLVLGPLLLTIGSFAHPEERFEAGEQIAIVMEQATRWYVSHAFLFVGLVLFVPGLLALTGLIAERYPRVSYAARIFVMIGVVGLAGVFTGEMLLGRIIDKGADAASAQDLLDSLFTPPVVLVVVPAALCFFVGIVTTAIALVRRGGAVRWPAASFGVGGLFILAEIITAQYVLAMIGSVLVFAGTTAIAWMLVKGELPETRTAS